MSKPTIYTAFAHNCKEDLPNLTEESMKISNALRDLAFKDQLYHFKDELLNVEKMLAVFQDYGSKIDIFYFSGHGKDGCLLFTDNFETKQGSMASLMATYLNNIQLIFLNACQTFEIAKELVQKHKNKNNIVIVSCPNLINSFVAERFATAFFKQIGQEGDYRQAYNQAKEIIIFTNSNIRFREFDSENDIAQAGNDFDFGYIQLTSGKINGSAGATPPPEPAKSIIDTNKRMLDALTTNYFAEVVGAVIAAPGASPEKTMLQEALEKCSLVANGHRKTKSITALFDKAAAALPGLSSGNTFNALINTEKNIKDSGVQSLIKSDGSVIKNLLNQVQRLTI